MARLGVAHHQYVEIVDQPRAQRERQLWQPLREESDDRERVEAARQADALVLLAEVVLRNTDGGWHRKSKTGVCDLMTR